MTTPSTPSTFKPGYHTVHVDLVRAWRKSADVDRGNAICIYCDEAGHERCSESCGFNHVWVDTATLAKINLEGARP